MPELAATPRTSINSGKKRPSREAPSSGGIPLGGIGLHKFIPLHFCLNCKPKIWTRPFAKHRLRSPMNAGIGSQEVQFRLEGTKGVERMSSGVMGWRVSLTKDNTRVYPRTRGAADRADGPCRTRLPATSRTSINSRKECWWYFTLPENPVMSCFYLIRHR